MKNEQMGLTYTFHKTTTRCFFFFCFVLFCFISRPFKSSKKDMAAWEQGKR